MVPLWVPAFFGDSNRTLKEIQGDSYPALSFGLFDKARARCLAENEQTGADAELCRRLREMETPGPQFLPRVYRRLAAFYRYALDREPRSGEEEGGLDGLQAGWEAFFREEARFLVEGPETVRQVLVAAAQTGAEAARAEDRLVEVLHRRYGELTLRRRQELLRRTLRRGDMGRQIRAALEVRAVADARLQVRPNPPD